MRKLKPPNEDQLEDPLGEAMQQVAADARAATSQALPPIRKLRVTWGEETVKPADFSSMRYGGLEVEVDVPPGADPRAIYEQTYALLDELAEQQFQRKLTSFYKRIRATRQQQP